jgi:hypothetical protein
MKVTDLGMKRIALIFTGQWKNFCKHISEVMESCDSERQEYYAGEIA